MNSGKSLCISPFFALKASSSATNAGGSTRSMAGYRSSLLSEAAARSTLRDAGTGKDAGTSLAAGDGSLTEATILCCSASTESTGSTVEGGFVGSPPRKENPSILGVGLTMTSLLCWKLSKVAIYLKWMGLIGLNSSLRGSLNPFNESLYIFIWAAAFCPLS